MKKWLVGAVVLVVLAACATSPTGRKQFIFMSESQMAAMGVQSFQQMQQDVPVLKDENTNAYVQCIADALTQLPQVQSQNGSWEVVVFDSEAVNAFALPGGKIGVYTGLLAVAENQHQLAAVMGHEVGHVLARHGAERVSQNVAIDQMLSLLENWMSASNVQNRSLAMSALGLGSQFGVLLPFSRLHESEADNVGLELMASAGFDPRQSVNLWQNMGKNGGKAPPEFMSTHPSHDTRIEDLNSEMAKAITIYDAARAAGKQPNCQR